MAKEVEVSEASPADVAADMEAHRATYGRFFNLLKWAIVGVAVILVILFFMFD